MYVKNNKGLIAIIIILAILVIALGVYIFKRESIRQWVSKDVQKTTEENNTKYEEDVNKIITLGTGMKRPSQYKPSEQYYIIDNRKYELDTLVNSLKNEELKKEINTFIKESTEKLENKRSDFQQYIEEGNKEREKIEWAGNKLDYYRVISTNLNLGDESDPIQIFTEWKCTNGYLSISLSYKYAYGEQISSSYNKKQKRFNYGPYEIYCATYDLYTGKRIQFSDLFFEGQRPAVNVGLSVSRVGGAAQTKAMKKASGSLRINLAQYREMKEFTQFASDLDDATKRQLQHGQVLMELLKQPLNHPMSHADMVIVLVVADAGILDDLDPKQIKKEETKLLDWFNENHSEISREINTTKKLDDNLKTRIITLAKQYRGQE